MKRIIALMLSLFMILAIIPTSFAATVNTQAKPQADGDTKSASMKAVAYLCYDSDDNYSEGFYELDLDTGNISFICDSPLEGESVFAAEYANGKIYAATDKNSFVVMDGKTFELLNTYTIDYIGKDFAYDAKTGKLYGVISKNSEEYLAEISMSNGSIVSKKDLGFTVHTLAINSNGFYMIDFDSDEIYFAKDYSTTPTSLYDSGIDVNYIQTMAANPSTDVIYWLGYSSHGFTATVSHTAVNVLRDTTYEFTGLMFIESVISVTGVTLDKTSITVGNGKAVQLNATVSPSDASNKNIIWSSSNESVAKVDESGRVFATGKGNAVITAKTEDGGFTATCNVTSEGPLKGTAYLCYDATGKNSEGFYEVNIDSGEVYYLADSPVSGDDIFGAEFYNGKVYVTTNNKSFAILDGNTFDVLNTYSIDYLGKDLAYDYRTNKLYGAIQYDEKQYLAEISMTDGSIIQKKEVGFTLHSLAINSEGFYMLDFNEAIYFAEDYSKAPTKLYDTVLSVNYVQTMAANHGTDDIFWLGYGSSGYTAIVSKTEETKLYDSTYEFTGLMFPGSAQIGEPVTGVTLDKDEVILTHNEPITLTATIAPVDAGNKNVTWSSSDESIVSVNDGVLTAKGLGTATVTVKTADGGFTDTVNVRVVSAKTSIFVEDFEDTLTGWEIIDSDGDGFNWNHVQDSSSGYSGTGYMETYSYDNGTMSALTPDNWLVSPAIAPDNQSELSFYTLGYDRDYANEHYGVYAIPTSKGELDLSKAVLLHEAYSIADWRQDVVDLSQFAGQEIRIAFRHYNITDMFMLMLDLVEVSAVTYEMHTVTYVDGVTNETIGTEQVAYGKDATLPTPPTHEGYTFTGWDKDGKNITEDTTITANYTEGSASYKLGDVNGDGVVNTGDAVLILKYAASMVEFNAQQMTAAEVTGDGTVNTGDAVFILKYAAGMVELPEK